MVIVTNHKWVNKFGEARCGFYINGYLKNNLDGIPRFLKQGYDCVGIISGHGKVRIGKSTLAAQIGFYIAWMLAGGRTYTEEWGTIIDKKDPKKPVKFSFENVVFSPEQLIYTARNLFNKYGPNQVIVYDEGRAGLDSARAMENINKAMQDFFQECGVMGHVILVVLPNFFKLHEDYATARSVFLIDCFSDRNFKRGYFNFYNERSKEFLYYNGKKRIGVLAKYASARPNFWGRFTKFFPLDEKTYQELKIAAMGKSRVKSLERKWKGQRDAAVFALAQNTSLTYSEIAKIITKYSGESVGEIAVKNAIMNQERKGVDEDGA